MRESRTPSSPSFSACSLVHTGVNISTPTTLYHYLTQPGPPPSLSLYTNPSISRCPMPCIQRSSHVCFFFLFFRVNSLFFFFSMPLVHHYSTHCPIQPKAQAPGIALRVCALVLVSITITTSCWMGMTTTMVTMAPLTAWTTPTHGYRPTTHPNDVFDDTRPLLWSRHRHTR
jgi:hypothetical protein